MYMTCTHNTQRARGCVTRSPPTLISINIIIIITTTPTGAISGAKLSPPTRGVPATACSLA